MLLTTSRRTSQRTRTFCRELASLFPLCEYCNRGKKSVRELLDYALLNGHEHILVVETKDGNPSRIAYLKGPSGLVWVDTAPITARTRKDLRLSVRVPPLTEDGIIGVRSSVDWVLTQRIASFFEATPETEEGDVVIQLSPSEKGVAVTFLRPDVSGDPVGPAITVVAE
jgi:hypothetical protein